MSTVVAWEVRFCEKCFCAFDVRARSRASVCEECIKERRRQNTLDWRNRHPERVHAHRQRAASRRSR